jgi:hypothetical protein
MQAFQKTVLGIAIVILIISLIIIGIILRNGKYSQTWPPVTPDCPDYWVDLSGSGGFCVNDKNLGTCKTPMNFTTSQYTGSNGACAKYNWANNCNISWDGITYGVDNPCNSTSTS